MASASGAGGGPESVGVVLLSWNRCAEIVNTLDHLRSMFDGEIVVVDQGSHDGSKEALEARDDLVLIVLDENVGVAEGRNIGNRMASADVVVSLDSDATLDPSFDMGKLIRHFVDAPDLAAVAFRIVDTHGQREEWPHAMPDASAGYPFESTRFHGAGHALRRAAFLEVGGYDPSLFFYWEEMDLSAKLIASGYTVMYLPEFVVHHSPAERSRVRWEDSRYFFRTRNRVYLIRKYFRGWARLRELAYVGGGYLLLGARTGLLRPAVRGLWAGLRMPVAVDEQVFDLGRFYKVWEDLERRNRPNPRAWLQKTIRLIRGNRPA